MSLPSIEAFKWADGRYLALRITSWSDAARVVLVRGTTKEAHFDVRQTSNADRSLLTTDFRIPEIPFALECETLSTAVRRGQLWVSLALVVGGLPMGEMGHGYLQDNRVIRWPFPESEQGSDGPGATKIISLGNPAANVEYTTVTVPTSARWKVRGFAGQLVTDANVAAREFTIDYDDGTNVFAGAIAANTQPASITGNYRGSLGFPSSFASGALVTTDDIGVALPDLFLEPASRLTFITRNLQVTDNWGAGFLQVEEWLTT